MTEKPEQPNLPGVPDPEPAQLLARFSAMAVKTVYPFTAKRDLRYWLMGINVRPIDKPGVMISATDGHRFICFHDPNGMTEKEITVTVEKDALKHAVDAESTFDVMTTGQAKLLDKHGHELFVQPGKSLIEDGSFPRIENVVSLANYREGIQGAVNPSYIAAALEAGERFGAVRFFTRDSDSPLLFVFDAIGDMQCFGGIMKLRDAFESLPAWFPLPSAVNSLRDM